MMRKTILTATASLTMAAIFAVSPTNASVYNFTFESADATLTVEGDFTVNASGEVTTVSGTISGLVDQTINGVAANPNFPGPANSPDGSFIYNNLYYSASSMHFDIDGLLFTTAQNPGGFWNLWGTGPGRNSLYESVGGGNYPIQAAGGLKVVAAPEPSTWTMLALGLAGLGVAGRRRAPRSAGISLE